MTTATTPPSGNNNNSSNASSRSDPASMINRTVKIQNLISKPELNMQLGIVKSYNLQNNRYTVQLYSASPISPPISLKADNLVHASYVEKAKGQILQMKTMIQFIRTNPEVRNEFIRIYSIIQDKLPNGVKPEYAIGGVLLLLIFLIHKIGFFRCIMIFSILGMLITVSLPDLMAGVTDIKILARNFPARWRNVIHENTGYTLSPKVANGLLIGILILSTKILLTDMRGGSIGTGNKSSKLTQTELDMMNNDNSVRQNGRPKQTTGPSWTIEEIYKMGYDDGMKNDDYGSSLPENHETFHFSSSSTGSSSNSAFSTSDFEYDYKPTTPPFPPSPKKKSNIGFGTLLSMFGLFRSVKELGFVNGAFDFNVFKANVQTLPPLKMALMGLLLYRVVSAFI